MHFPNIIFCSSYWYANKTSEMFCGQKKLGVFMRDANSIGMAPLMTLSPRDSGWRCCGPKISGSQATLSVSKGLKNKCRHRSGGVCRWDDWARVSRLLKGLFTPLLSPKTSSILPLSWPATIPQTERWSRFDTASRLAFRQCFLWL